MCQVCVAGLQASQLFFIFTLTTVANATMIIFTLWSAALCEICRSLNNKLQSLVDLIGVGCGSEVELDELIAYFHR